MKFERVLPLTLPNVLRLKDDSEGFQDGDCYTSVVVGPRSCQKRGEEQVDAVLMGTNDNSFVALAWDGSDDGKLTPRMRELGD